MLLKILQLAYCEVCNRIEGNTDEQEIAAATALMDILEEYARSLGFCSLDAALDIASTHRVDAPKFAAVYWTAADIIDEDFGLRPRDPQWTEERAEQFMARVENDLTEVMCTAGIEFLEEEIAFEENDGFAVISPDPVEISSRSIPLRPISLASSEDDWLESAYEDRFSPNTNPRLTLGTWSS